MHLLRNRRPLFSFLCACLCEPVMGCLDTASAAIDTLWLKGCVAGLWVIVYSAICTTKHLLGTSSPTVVV